MTNRMDAVSVIGEVGKAATALKPLRVRILAAAHEPASATAIAARVGRSRQVVNYHVRALARAGYLRRAGRQRKRGLVEQKYVVSARAFFLAPDVLNPIDPRRVDDGERQSVAYLLTLAARMQKEIGHAWRESQKQEKRVPVLALDSEIAFSSPEQRALFADALASAIARVIAEHTSPTNTHSGGRSARTYRLALGCYPV
jgi:hypothetical protein